MKYPESSILEARGLSCIRGDTLLFENLNFEVCAGEIHQIHGANGRGKTSLLRIICQLSLSESGILSWNGVDIQEQRDEFFTQLTYIGHHNGIKAQLTPLENLDSHTQITGCREGLDVVDVLSKVGLYGYEDIPTRHLSAGQKRRVAIARLYLSNAQLWVLDEPATALDTNGIAEFQKLLEFHVRHGGMVLITSHQPLKFGEIETGRIEL